MKEIKFYFIIILILINSCAKNINDSNCNNLLNLDVFYEVNLNLPQYSQLNFISNSVYIPNGSKHRLENKLDKPLNIIEVQTGSYFGEDDIKRYEDDYNRS